MEWIVTTARTVEEAQTRALDLLGVDTADAEMHVIEEGKTGLFGRTKSEARVRARIKPKAPPAKDERRPSRGGGDRNRNRGGGGNNKGGGGRNRNRGGGNRDGGNRDGGNRGGGNRGGGNRDGGNRGGGNRDGGNRGGGNRDGGRESSAAEAGKAAAASGGGRNRNRGGKGNNRDRDGGRNRNDRSNEDRVEMPVDEQRETLEAFVTGVAKGFDRDSTVELVEEGTTLLAQVRGDDLGRLIGAKAATLQAFEELARTAMHRAAAGRRYHRIQVDVDEYRARRREALERFATDLAKDVAETGQSKAMEPMGAADRKLIHDAVAEVAGVETVSEGRDPRRYIVILPTDATDEEE